MRSICPPHGVPATKLAPGQVKFFFKLTYLCRALIDRYQLSPSEKVDSHPHTRECGTVVYEKRSSLVSILETKGVH